MHDWKDIGDGYVDSSFIEWCTLCGAIRHTDYDREHTAVYFPYAYQKVSETTCAKARKQREAANAAGRNRLGRTSAELAAGEVRVGSRATPIPSAPAECDAGHEE